MYLYKVTWYTEEYNIQAQSFNLEIKISKFSPFVSGRLEFKCYISLWLQVQGYFQLLDEIMERPVRAHKDFLNKYNIVLN